MSARSDEVTRGQMTDQEWQLRVDLAACYRLIALHGWDDLVFTHVSARIPGPDEHFLINAYGLMFEEITASSLVKVDLHGQILDDTDYSVNPAGFVIHSAIHEARPDVTCIIHTHTVDGVAVSAQRDGLLPISQTNMFPYCSLAYHDYEGVALLDAEKPRLVADLGDKAFFILRNHGLLTVASTIADAFLQQFMFEKACSIQVRAQAGGAVSLNMVDKKIQQGMLQQAKQVTKGIGGAIAWPALVRKLDRLDPSYKE